MRHSVLAIALLVALGFAPPVLAKVKADFADCVPGKGCTCVVGHVDLDDYQLAIGTPAPEGAANMTLVSYEGDLIWSNSSFEDLDLIAGGDGICAPQVFMITPEDGIWKGSVRLRDIKGCLPQVAEMVPPMVDAMGTVKQITWGGKFHPSQFVVGNAPTGIRWTERSPTHFDGVLPIPANGTLDVSVTATATLTAPDRAEATMALRLAAAPGVDAKALALLGMSDCKVDAIYDFERTGP